MGIKSTTIQQKPKPREEFYIDRGADIIKFGKYNDYPQRVSRILNASPSGVACRSLLQKFIVGKAWEDQGFGKSVVNFKGQTANTLLRMVARDYAEHSYFGLHVNYNLNYTISSITRIDPKYMRLGLPDSFEFSPQIALHPNWTADNNAMINKRATTDADLIDVFYPDPAVIQRQIERAGGITQYKGQVFAYWGDEQGYPLARYDSILLDLQTDALIPLSNYTRLDKGFIAKQAFVFSDVLGDGEREEIKRTLKAAQGADGDDILVIDGAGEANVRIVPFNHTYTDQDNVNTERLVRQRIMRTFNQPSILHSEERANALSADGAALENAYAFYNQVTIDDRRIIQESFEYLFSHFVYNLNPEGNFEIEPAQFLSSAQAGENTAAETETDQEETDTETDTETEVENGND